MDRHFLLGGLFGLCIFVVFFALVFLLDMFVRGAVVCHG